MDGKSTRELQRDLIHLLIISMAVSSLFIAPLLYFRNLSEGGSLQSMMLAFPIVSCALAIFRHSFPTRLLAFLFVALLCSTFISGMVYRAFFGPAFFFVIIAMLMLSYVLPFKQLLGAMVLLISLCIIVSAGYFLGWYQIVIDPAAMLNSPLAWAAYMSIPLYVVILIVFATHRYVTAYTGLLSKLETKKEELEFLAEHDTLTGLPNMRVMQNKAEQAISSAERYKHHLALLFIDLDGFKGVNDSRGHDAGDLALKQVAQVLQDSLREEDICARIGGDEFLVLLNGVKNDADAAGVARKIIKQICQPIAYEDVSLEIGASVGISIFPEDGEDLQTLKGRADEAMYKVKHTGKNNYRFSDSHVVT